MKLIERIKIAGGGSERHIELLLGDLTQIPPEHAVDLLVVSAFHNDYSPSPTSLIGALDARGLSVKKLASDKQDDLRASFSCWLSKELSPKTPGLAFSRILCFEPRIGGRPPELVGQIFQALAPFTFVPPHIKSVALPVLASGDQGYSIATMLPPLLDAATHWLQAGFPISVIKLVVRTERDLGEALPLFKAAAPKGSPASASQSSQPLPTWRYGVFVSYSREDERAADWLVSGLNAAGLRVFIDRLEIEAGAAWQQKIFDALDECGSTAALLSPSFLQSKVCKEEFNIAWMRRRENDVPLFPLFIRDATLPTYMRSANYIDCRTNDQAKIAGAALQLARVLKQPSQSA